MKDYLYLGAAVSLLAIGCTGYFLMKDKTKSFRFDNDTYDSNTDTVYSLIKKSRTTSVFAKRYANYLIRCNGNKSRADGYYLSVLHNWGILSQEELIETSSKFFNLADYKDEISNSFGEDGFINILIKVINFLGTHYDSGIYDDYDTIEDAVTWERLIPELEDYLIIYAEKNDFDMFEKVFICLFSLYAQADYAYFNKKCEEINKIIDTSDVSTLSARDITLYGILCANKDSVTNTMRNLANKAGV